MLEKARQAARLAEIYGIPAISTGDIFRSNVKNGTELGNKAKAFMDAGDTLPDSLTNALIRDRLEEADAKNGFLTPHGYPRTTDQVRELDAFLASNGSALDVVVELEADPEVVIDRLRKRALEQGRSDDTEEVVRHRLEVYSEQTAPLVKTYASRDVLVTIDALGEIDAVTARITEALFDRGISATDAGSR